MKAIRTTITMALDDMSTPVGRLVNGAIAFLVLVSSIIFIAETYSIPDHIRHQLTILNGVILCIFSIEYLFRFWCADNKWAYLKSLYSIVDLVAILPFFLGVLDVSYLLVLRWLRILKLLRSIRGDTILGYLNGKDSVILARIIFTLFAIVFVYSGLIYQVEHPINPNLRTFLDAMYFAVATMTTVGFGDITPISEGGRLLTILMIWTGIGLIPWQVGNLVKRLFQTPGKVERPCSKCSTRLHEEDAEFCRVCGTSLSSPTLQSSIAAYLTGR
ncbi:MAG: ion transporter [Cyanobacteria bacterium P01_F01_bin.150]